MTIKQAKTIPLAAFLQKLGYASDITKKQVRKKSDKETIDVKP